MKIKLSASVTKKLGANEIRKRIIKLKNYIA